MNDSLDDVLQRYFDDIARDDRLGDTPVRVVMRRGRRRKARRRTSAMAGTLVVGAVGSVVAVRTLSGGGNERTIQVGNEGSTDGGSPAPIPTTGDVTLSASPLVWNEVTVGSAEAIVLPWMAGGVLTGSDGSFYALSTEPGRTNEWNRALYRSTDGLHWARTGSGTELPLDGPSSLTFVGDRLYASGTMAAYAPTSGSDDPAVAAVATSTDGGGTWDEHVLPFDLDRLRGLPHVERASLAASVAGVGDTVAVAAVSRAGISQQNFAPAGVSPDSLMYNASGATEFARTDAACTPTPTTVVAGAGVDDAVAATATTTAFPPDMTFPPGGCLDPSTVVRNYSWAELGLPAETAAELGGRLHLALSTDGTTFQEVDAPPMPDGWQLGDVQLRTVGGELALAVNLLRPLPLDDVANGDMNERSVAAFTSADGMTWTPLDVPLDSVGSIGELADGSVVFTGAADQGTAVAVRRDGTWHVTQMGSLAAMTDPTLVGMPMGSPQIGPTGIVAMMQVAQPTPPPTADDITASTAPVGYLVDTTRYLLAFSADGVTWSIDDLGDRIGAGRYPGLALIMGGQVIVDVGGGMSTIEGPLPDRTVLVGTLR